MSKEREVARIQIKGFPKMGKVARAGIVLWLRQTARDLETTPKAYASRFTARYFARIR